MAELLKPLEELREITHEEDLAVLHEITEPVVAPLLNRHIDPRILKDPSIDQEKAPSVDDYFEKSTHLWVPASFTPLSLGRNYPKDYIWTPEDSPLPEMARLALWIGLLTEDNLPWYTETIYRGLGKKSEPLKIWNGIWTGEEDRHAEVMRIYMTLGRVVDPNALDEARMRQLILGEVPSPQTSVELAVYVIFQELATRISHQNTGKLIDNTSKADSQFFPLTRDGTELANIDHEIVSKFDPEERKVYFRQIGRAIMTRVAGDENRHFAFYHDLVKDGALPVNASIVILALEKQLRQFMMPGTGIKNFKKHAFNLALAGIYDPDIHINKIVIPVIKSLGIMSIKDIELTDEAKQARDRLAIFIEQERIKAKSFVEKRQVRRDTAIENGDQTYQWVGRERDERLSLSA